MKAVTTNYEGIIHTLGTVGIKSLYTPFKMSGLCDLIKMKLRLIMPLLFFTHNVELQSIKNK